MKKIISLSLIALAAIIVTSCSDESSLSDPFKEQSRQPFFPKNLSFRSTNNNGTVTEDSWVFEYNSDNTVKRYTCIHKITGYNLDIEERRIGDLRYYNDYTGSKCIEAKVYVDYSSRKLAEMLTYTDTITEDVVFSGNYISSINTKGWRTTSGDRVSTLSSKQTFNYTNDLCTGSTFIDNNNEKTYTYSWKNNMLVNVVVHNQNKKNSDLTHDTYEYSYNNKIFATNYVFNPLAFIYNNKPLIYDAMGYMGKSTPYLLELEKYDGYENINGKKYDIQSEQHSYHIMSGTNSLIYSAESPGYSEYIYNFSE